MLGSEFNDTDLHPMGGLQISPDGGTPQTDEKTVLVIEDDKEVRDILKFDLENSGYNVELFDNGDDGWNYLEEGSHQPDAVILDIMVPGRDGMQILQNIREDNELNDIPVIMLSSLSREENIIDGFESGATYYVTKPFQTKELISRVQRVIQNG
ncbi:MAG: response regulator transcription factor [Halobacteriaceae archaeon]